MSQPILAIKPCSASNDDQTQKNTVVIPHLLPCRINHSGPIGPVPPSFWNPQASSITDDQNHKKQTSYFRGRKLNGRQVPLPNGYKGVVASTSTSTTEGKNQHAHDYEEVIDLEKEDCETLEVQGEFEEIVVWGLEGSGELVGDDNVYVRGVEEWVGVAGAVHSFDVPREKDS